MQRDEYLSLFIAQRSALPPRKRLETFRAIENSALRRDVAKSLPPELYGRSSTNHFWKIWTGLCRNG
jgi:hypothetical protein